MGRHFILNLIFDSHMNARFALIFYVVVKHVSSNIITVIPLFVNQRLHLLSVRPQLLELNAFVCRVLHVSAVSVHYQVDFTITHMEERRWRCFSTYVYMSALFLRLFCRHILEIPIKS